MDQASIVIRGAREHNLKHIDLTLPRHRFVVFTGVSGSGKSSLIAETLYPALATKLNGVGGADEPGAFRRLDGLQQLDKVIDITQDPIGRMPRSNPASYVGVYDDIRALFELAPEARARGYKAGRLSFNVKGGRCEACEGHGQKKVEMHFLPDVRVTCDLCKGTRFNRETLQIKYKGQSIAEVLDMDVQQAVAHFANVPKVARILQTLHDVGLDYIQLGQPATTLSGGEAQRVKLANELCRPATGRTLYILDEPAVGLHAYDVAKLMQVLQTLLDRGNTVIAIEPNLDVIASADWLVDLGPEGGAVSGRIVAQGTPEDVACEKGSYTGQYLKGALGMQPA